MHPNQALPTTISLIQESTFLESKRFALENINEFQSNASTNKKNVKEELDNIELKNIGIQNLTIKSNVLDTLDTTVYGTRNNQKLQVHSIDSDQSLNKIKFNPNNYSIPIQPRKGKRIDSEILMDETQVVNNYLN